MRNVESANYQKEIERCSRVYDGFKDAAGFKGAVFGALESFFDEHSNLVSPLSDITPDHEENTNRLNNSESLRLTPDYDTVVLSKLFDLVCKEIVKANPASKEVMEEVNNSLETFWSRQGLKVSPNKVFQLRDLLIKETALENDMATFLFSLVLSSIYRRYLQSPAEVLRTDLWEGGDCPLCGEKPHFGMLLSEDGTKQLECWLCGTRWAHTRIKCPFCNNEEQENLGYFTIEGNDICRVNFCKSCYKYYKIFDARKFQTDGDLVLTVHNLATLNYDLRAREEGFTPGSCLEWVNEKEIANRQD